MFRHASLRLGVLLIAGSLVLSGCINRSPDQVEPESESVQDSAAFDAEMLTLARAMETGASVRCTAIDENAQSLAEYLVKDKNMKIISTDPSGQKSYVLILGTTQYIWTEGNPTGMMYTINEEQAKEFAQEAQERPAEPLADEPTTAFTEEADESEESPVQFSCDRANISDSEFAVPTNVTFTNLFENMPEFTTP